MTLKEKNTKRVMIAIVIVIIILIASFSFIFLTSQKQFKVTVLNLSNKDLEIFVRTFYNTSKGAPNDAQCAFIKNNESYSFTIKTIDTDFAIEIETENTSLWNTINRVYHIYQSNELYDKLVIIQNFGENITIVKMPN